MHFANGFDSKYCSVQETFRSCSDISVSRPPRSVDQQEGLLKLRVMKRLIEVMKKREKVRRTF